jgi:phosphoribosylformylglycinamidine synthase subunit PurQ / glutaminase
MSQPNVLILRAPGTNCDQETAFAFQQAGAKTEVLHVNRLLENPGLFGQFQILCIPGGFSYGDDLAAGRILGAQMQHHLSEAMNQFKAGGKLILGICNGFQVLMRSSVLLEPDEKGNPIATLTNNDSGRYEDRWVRLATSGGQSQFSSAHGGLSQFSSDENGTVPLSSPKCVFLAGIGSMYLPVAHAEGKFVARDADAFDRLESDGRLVLRYVAQSPASTVAQPPSAVPNQPAQPSSAVQNLPTQPRAAVLQNRLQISSPSRAVPARHTPLQFPDNPNGSMGNVAGVCDTTGRVLGMMPHPERHIDPTQHPRWTRGESGPIGDGLQVFINAVRYFI